MLAAPSTPPSEPFPANPYPGMPPSSPAAEAYGMRLQALGRASALDPVGMLEHGSDPGQRLHVYAPARTGAGPLPLLLFFHGGAWVSGGLSWLRFMAPAVTSLPALFVAGTYRLAPASRWPAALEDVCAAIALTAQRAADFGADPSRIIVGGHSSGGHLAALAVLQQRSPPVRACFPVSSSFDLRYGNVPDDSAEGRVYRYLLQRREQDAEASPLLHVRGDTVPFHITWGQHDFDRIVRTSQAMVDALRAVGSAPTQCVVPGSDHFDTHLRLADAADPWYRRLHEEMYRG